MQRAILNKSWRQHPTKQQLYAHLPPIKLDESEMWDTAGEVRTNSLAIYSCGYLDMDEQWSDNQLEPIYNSSVGCPRGVMVKAIDCSIVVSEFVLQSRYYVHFRANTFGKGDGYHLPFQHNELGHLPYLSVARTPEGSPVQISLRADQSTSHTRRAVPIVEVYPYSITNPMFLLITVSLL